MEKELVGFDGEEYKKQIKEEILKEESYIHFEFLSKASSNEPFCSLKMKQISPIDVAKFLIALEQTFNKIKEQHEKEYLLDKLCFGCDTQVLSNDTKKKEKNDKNE